MHSLKNMNLKQLNEMNSKAKHLCALMKQGVVEFIFKKKSTGQTRKAKGTLKRDIIPPQFQRKRGRPKKRPEDSVIYYDIDKKDIRSFKDYLLQKITSKPVDISKTDGDVNSSSEKSSKQNPKNNNKNKPSSISKKPNDKQDINKK